MNTEELQSQIKSVIAALNWKLPKLAEVLFVAMNDDDIYDEQSEVNAFYEKLRGHLKRKTTPPELLNNYLNIITNHPEYIKSDTVVTKYVKYSGISDDVRSDIEAVSKAITLRVKNDDL